jgi:hypothetical protein
VVVFLRVVFGQKCPNYGEGRVWTGGNPPEVAKVSLVRFFTFLTQKHFSLACFVPMVAL